MKIPQDADTISQVAGIIIDRLTAELATARQDALEEAAKVHEPSCSCEHPCDDYWSWPSPCHKKAAVVIRALKDKPPQPREKLKGEKG